MYCFHNSNGVLATISDVDLIENQYSNVLIHAVMANGFIKIVIIIAICECRYSSDIVPFFVPYYQGEVRLPVLPVYPCQVISVERYFGHLACIVFFFVRLSVDRVCLQLHCCDQ
jgi:hypothetical protein